MDETNTSKDSLQLNLTNVTGISLLNNETQPVEIDKVTLVFTTIIAGILALVTIFGNIFVILAYHMDRQLQTLSNRFLISLAVADTSIGVISIPMYTLYLQMGYWPLGTLVCDLWLCMDYTMSNASVVNLLVICLDRFLSIRKPIEYRIKRTKRVVDSMICVAWIISIALWTPWIIAWPYIDGYRIVSDTECYIQFLVTNTYITIVTALVAFYIPVSVMMVMYFFLFKETTKRKRRLSKATGSLTDKYNSTRKSTHSIVSNTEHKSEGSCFACFKRFFDFDDEEDDGERTSSAYGMSSSDISERSVCDGQEKTISIVSNKVKDRSCAKSMRENPVLRRFVSRMIHTKTERTQKKQDMRAAKTLTVILLVFIVTWLPYNIAAVIFPFCPDCISSSVWSFGMY